MQKRGAQGMPARGHAAGTVPLQPLQPRAAPMRRFGTGVLCAGLAALGATALYRLLEKSRRTVSEALAAAGGTGIWSAEDTAHLGGTCRMGTDPKESVTNADGRSWDIPNLWICDGSLFPTVAGVNPSLTIQALAWRIGDRIREQARREDSRKAETPPEPSWIDLLALLPLLVMIIIASVGLVHSTLVLGGISASRRQ